MLHSHHVCQGELDEADALLTRAIEIKERALGPDHPSLATSLSALATILQAQVWEFPGIELPSIARYAPQNVFIGKALKSTFEYQDARGSDFADQRCTAPLLLHLLLHLQHFLPDRAITSRRKGVEGARRSDKIRTSVIVLPARSGCGM